MPWFRCSWLCSTSAAGRCGTDSLARLGVRGERKDWDLPFVNGWLLIREFRSPFQKLLSLAVVLQFGPVPVYVRCAAEDRPEPRLCPDSLWQTTLLLAGSSGLLTTVLGIALAFFPAQQITSLRSYEIWMFGALCFFIGPRGVFLLRLRQAQGRAETGRGARTGIMKLNLEAVMSSSAATVVRTYQNYINGQWVKSSSGEMFPVYDPSTEEVIAACGLRCGRPTSIARKKPRAPPLIPAPGARPLLPIAAAFSTD